MWSTNGEEEDAHITRYICADSLLAIPFGLLLRLANNEFCNMTIEVIVCDRAGHRRAHGCTDEVGDDRGE
jgi:hypothetical protein